MYSSTEAEIDSPVTNVASGCKRERLLQRCSTNEKNEMSQANIASIDTECVGRSSAYIESKHSKLSSCTDSITKQFCSSLGLSL